MDARPPATRNESLSVRRSLRLVDVVRDRATEHAGVTTAELAAALDLHRSTVSRLVTPLVEHGLLRRDEAGTVRLGTGALALGQAYLASVDLPDLAAAHVRDLAARTGAACALGVPEGSGVRLVLTERSPRGSRSGALLPLHCTALGKAMLSVGPADWLDRTVAAGLPALTPRTITDAGELRSELLRTRRRGFALDDREHEPHVRAVAAPVLDAIGVVGAVSAGTSADRMPPAVLREHAQAAAETARTLSRALGWGRAQPSTRRP